MSKKEKTSIRTVGKQASIRLDSKKFGWIAEKIGDDSPTRIIHFLADYYIMREKISPAMPLELDIIKSPGRSALYQNYLEDIEAAYTKNALEIIEKELNNDLAVNQFERIDLLRKLRGKKETLK